MVEGKEITGKEAGEELRNFDVKAVGSVAKRCFQEYASRTLLLQRKIQPGPPVVTGLLSSAVGIGEGARLNFDALKQLGFDPACIDLRPTFPIHGHCQFETPKAVTPGGGTLIIHMNPPELSKTILALGRSHVQNRRLIGYWAWELPVIPPQWHRWAQLLDEIWVPSQFVADAVIASGVDKRVVFIVPLPVHSANPMTANRTAFGLDPESLVFLCTFDALSSSSRKNPWGAIDVFRRAFSDRRDITLLIKISHIDRVPGLMERLREHTNGIRVRIISEILDRPSMTALVSCCDVLLSLHRAEGFGLHLAEAMALGKAVVATNWSGNVDFMSEENSALVNYRLVPVSDPGDAYDGYEDQCWAEPDLEHAISLVQRLVDQPDWRQQLGVRARKVPRVLHERFSSAVLKRFGDKR